MTTADASAAHDVSAADGRTAPPNRASIRISASRATWASSAARLSLASASTSGHQAQGDDVAGLAAAQQVQDRRGDRAGTLGGPGEHGVRDRVAGEHAQVGDLFRQRRVGGPAEDGGDVDDGIGQAEVRGGDRAERVGAG